MASTSPSSLRLLPLFSALLAGVSALPHNKRIDEVPSATSLGCFTDNEGGKRALADDRFASDDMTVEKYQFFGLEYGIECYCGNSRDVNSKEAPAADCSFPCPGNGDQTCGAGNRLNLYSIANPAVQSPASLSGVTSLGCFVDSPGRILPNKIISTDDMTATKCALNCAGYPYFGTEWGRECYCGSDAPTVPAPLSECSMVCSGNNDELCGASMRLNVYKFDAPAPTTTQSETAPTTAPSLSVVDGFEERGCYTDNIPQRVLGGKTFADPAMTLAKCAAFCKASGYALFGTEYGIECYCSTTLDAGSLKVDDSECAMTCGGDHSQMCGGPNRLNLFADPTLGEAAGGNLASVGEFTYKSCWTDDTADRSLTALVFRTDDMSVEKCADLCKDYSYFGLEYSRECFCGDELGGHAAPEEDCSELCMGSDKQWCGGPVRLNIYAKGSVSSSTAPVVETTSSSDVQSTTISEVEPTTTTQSDSTTAIQLDSTTTTEVDSITTLEVDSTTQSEVESTSTPVLESTTTSEIGSTTTSEVEATSTSEAEPTTTSEIESTTTLDSESTTTLEILTTSSVALTTSSEAITSLAPVPASTTSTPITTKAPELTTITACLATPTYPTSALCFYPTLPVQCERLTSSFPSVLSRSMSNSLSLCRVQMTRFKFNVAASATACFPTPIATNPPNPAAATSTMRAVNSCLSSAMLCTLDSGCITNTYPVDEVPATLPTPTSTPVPDIGVDLFEDGDFESGTFGNWSLTGAALTSWTFDVSTGRAYTGRYAVRARNGNTSGFEVFVERTMAVVPGKQYQFKARYLTEKPVGNLYIQANEFGTDLAGAQLDKVTPNVWNEREVTFTANTNLVYFAMKIAQIVKGTAGSAEGMNTIWLDGFTLKRLN
ncbi:hypothetical protein NEMBOFW57_002029 [Staphylotrichum longicolle]|uniref:WSC domain-containing protein n=1 Tax=Staphylotrichum longicolle TaxID=669026 RepID=A0AAD4F387_9PEZI|nr:hypothetical protein NEMBOFW57_002029 [Staphylotrichum longicolle]